ncbi:MAG: hypothetical protein Q9183_006723, partial [Haloplaca sp. 2 TL-2023]
MPKKLHSPRRRFTDNLLRAVNAMPGRPKPEHHPPKFTTARRKPTQLVFPEKIPINNSPGRSIIRKYEASARCIDDDVPIGHSRGLSIIRKYGADPRYIFEDEPIGYSRGRSVIHKYSASPGKPWYYKIRTSGSPGYAIVVRRYGAQPDPRENGRDIRSEEKGELGGEMVMDPPSAHNADKIVLSDRESANGTALREEDIQELKKHELGALDLEASRHEIAEERAGATERDQEYVRWSPRGGVSRRPLAGKSVRNTGSASTTETVRHVSTVAGKRPLKPMEMDVERYHK